ncbi:leucyl aminopeptidase [soil metagenome]
MFESITLAEFDHPHVLILGRFQDHDLEPQLKRLDPAFAAGIRAAAARAEGSGESGKYAEAFTSSATDAKGAPLPARVIVLGLGKRDKLKPGDFRNLAATVGRRLAATKETRILVSLAAAAAEAEIDITLAGRAFGEGLGLLAWNNQQFKGKGTEAKPRPKLQLNADRKNFLKGLERGLLIAGAANLARTLSETPPNIATPRFMAEQAKAVAKAAGLDIRIIEGKELEKEKLAGLINVGKASENKPCLIRLAYTPDSVKKNKSRPIVLIGKTVTYDTGGLSLKINNGMVGMKRDKDGGCAVLAAMSALATTIKPSRPVIAYLCAAENSINEAAYRPDDILTYRNGVTVEVTNTDAEGRLVLADALCMACDSDDPHAIIELSTLTGGVVTALGSTYCGMFCDDDALRAKVERASDASGERVWRLPMHQEYREMMKSPVADILNSNPNRKAHAGQGAAFLSYFVKEGVPWCHLDIAGVHAVDADTGPYVKGPTGWGVRILCDLLSAE